MSTFQGLELAKKALFAQQSALYTTGHNIANVNTEGYSRQRVNFTTTTPYTVPSRVQSNNAGQMGTGVEIGTVQRIRDKFLDIQFRSENSKLSYWETRKNSLSRMEELLNEPSDNGLSKTMDMFWQSLQELGANPDNSGARSVVAERGTALAETFNHLSRSLQAIQDDLAEQIKASKDEMNSLLTQINNLNAQIQKIETHGYLANDLYDERDRLIDRLSEHMNIRVSYEESSESAETIAEGIVSIELLDETGNSFGSTDGDKIYLLDAKRDLHKEELEVIQVQYEEKDENDPERALVEGIVIGEEAASIELLKSIGSLSALIESHGYIEDGERKGDYPEMLQQLDRLAREFAEEFNKVHQAGANLEDEEARDFFVSKDSDIITAESLMVNEEIMQNVNLIAASDRSVGGQNGDNAIALSKVLENDIDNLDDSSPRNFYTSLIGKLGVDGQQAKGMMESSEILRDQVEHSRMSVSAVSLDEEISNLIKFQHAYNAAARNMTAIDEMIDRIINQMGLVGR